MKKILYKTTPEFELPKPIITKGRGLTKLCFAYYGVKRKFLESDKKLRLRTVDKITGGPNENEK